MAMLREWAVRRNGATAQCGKVVDFAPLRLCAIATFLAACNSPTIESPAKTLFASPLLARPMEEVFYGAYLDQGSRDYNCGAKFYAGHRGTDILLRNFRVQDSGVTVVAAAAGRVALTHDGEPDRNAAQSSQNQWNVVEILHADGITSVYGHLRRGSILVTTGQDVAAGAPLGLVGSSGFSNWPHLHFEVRRSGVPVDPWSGGCQIGGSLWASQLAYQNTFRVLDIGIQDRRLTTQAELLERPADPPKITGAGGVMSIWIELYNVRAEILRTELHDPSGTLVQSADYPQFLTFSTAYALATYPVTAGMTPGLWKVAFRVRTLGGPVLAEVAHIEFIVEPQGVAVRGGGEGSALKATLQYFGPGGDVR
jgi:murein DD-endopeptidase MepM/ murein hydrolase activator NlpD